MGPSSGTLGLTITYFFFCYTPCTGQCLHVGSVLYVWLIPKYAKLENVWYTICTTNCVDRTIIKHCLIHNMTPKYNIYFTLLLFSFSVFFHSRFFCSPFSFFHFSASHLSISISTTIRSPPSAFNKGVQPAGPSLEAPNHVRI
jgi:hypothetical protein